LAIANGGAHRFNKIKRKANSPFKACIGSDISHLRRSCVSCLLSTHGRRFAPTMGYGDGAPPVLFCLGPHINFRALDFCNSSRDLWQLIFPLPIFLLKHFYYKVLD